jgi:hypothetical protein
LPGQYSPQQIHEHISNRFNIVSPRLFNTHMRANTCVTSCSC